tara:strand:+ start:4620 stop:6608 length:1989 start_codon:yes stop_codon:yes gene_type:complete
MSLVITSNINLQDDPDTSEIFKPYSYTNRLSNTIKLPEDCEVAVQSVKINKNGLYSVNRANSKFGLYFGQDLTPALTLEETTNHPVSGSIINSNRFAELTPDDLKNEMLSALGRTINDPSHMASVQGTSTQDNPVLNASCDVVLKKGPDNEFQGYELSLDQKITNVDIIPPDDAPVNQFENAFFEYTGGELECTDPLSTDGCCVSFEDRPLTNSATSEADCSFAVNFDDANQDTLSRWCIGICRRTEPTFHPNGQFKANAPPYYDNKNSKGAGSNVAWNFSHQFYDYVVCRQGNFLRVFQKVINTDRNPRKLGTNKNHLIMKEVIYYGTHNADFPAVYDIDANADGYEEVLWRIEGEKVICQIRQSGKPAKDLVDFDVQSGKAGFNRYNSFTPRSCLQTMMYGKCYIKRNGDTMQIEERRTYDHITAWESKNPNVSWVNHLIRDGLYNTWGWKVERRDWNNYKASNSAVIYAPKGLNAGNGQEDYQVNLITEPSEEYGKEYTADFGSSNLFGMRGVPVAKPIGANLTHKLSKLESVVIPKLINNKSLFVRLNNFTFNTANARLGNAFSKLLCHLPRFDNSGNETGGLYFEPQERVYVALNNPDELYLNNFDVDIVYDNEEFAECLMGKTIVCLHFRQRGLRILDTDVKKEIERNLQNIVVRN